MILGMPTATFTLIHVAISLIGIATGFIVLVGLIANKRLNLWTMLFLVTTALTSITGYAFPNEHVTPGMIIGGISLVVLGIAAAAYYAFHLAGGWRMTYVITAAMALYFNVFVGVVQSFMKVPALHDLAPHQSEPPFAIAQGIVLLIFVILTVVAARKFHD